MRLFIQWEEGGNFFSFGREFKTCPKKHAIDLYRRHARPVEVKDAHSCLIASIHRDGNLVIYADHNERTVIQ